MTPRTRSALPLTSDLSLGTAGRRLARGLAVLTCLAAGAASAAPARLAAPGPDDLGAPAAIASDQPSTAPAGGPAQFTWAIDQASDELGERATPHVASSTGHVRTVSAAELRRGVALPVSAAGAFLKLSPQSGAGPVQGLTLVDPTGRVHVDGAGLQRVGSRDGGAFTLDPALGTGVFTVRGEATAAVHIDVLERGSDLVLLAQTASDVVFRGDDVAVEARLLHRGQPVAAERVQARLIAPDGRALTRALTRARDGSYRASLPARGELGVAGQTWTVEVTLEATVAGRPVRRSASTAVAVSVPTARPTGLAALDERADGLHAELELDVASPGRYAITTVLYGRNRDGQLQPIAVGQSADQLEPGKRRLGLVFDAATLAASGLHGPYELRDLRLVDQGRLFVLHRQARALGSK